MENPKPQADKIEVNGLLYIFKCYLKMKAFSYRCIHHYTHSCKYLLTIPLTPENYEPDAWKFVAAMVHFKPQKKGIQQHALIIIRITKLLRILLR